MTYEVEYEQVVVIKYIALVDAETSSEARKKVLNREIISEEELGFEHRDSKILKARKGGVSSG
ncbi:hypothetical protein [Thermoactinomyces sp. DSM 45892]|uniref:hypothetical protein n=1 Tax=Thermoactinomyces sp. DSM 45892 TaxID=1882753 RepID=UPI0008987F66|nr:hypothetical protein [Thermoactinomyces sp. DSM 45892]SDX96638.1 hypothetical protein SAMN05444416_101122 [Thermoactinomyces sp. DSM 45892]